MTNQHLQCGINYDVFYNRTTQDEIFSVGVKDIVESVLDGYNGSIIANGQTGIYTDVC